MWLIASAGTFLRWAYSVYRKILRIAPGSIALVVLATLVSQLSRLAAFFLPLKIVLLVGGSRVPSYFPGFLRTQPPETVVIELAALTVVFYVLHQLSEKVVAFHAERSADLLLGRADKLVMFANQEGVARNACQKLAESLAALIFVALSLVLIRLVHHNMALFLVGWVAAAVLFVATGGAWSARFRAWLDGNAKSFVTGVSQTSLFAATAFIVGEFVAGAKFNILYAIISLLLAREALQQLANAVNNALALNPLKPLVNAMFFQNHAWPGVGGAQRKDVWDWVVGDRLAQWLPGILRDVTGKPAQRPTMELWHQTGMTDLFVFDAATGRAISSSFSRPRAMSRPPRRPHCSPARRPEACRRRISPERARSTASAATCSARSPGARSRRRSSARPRTPCAARALRATCRPGS